MKIKKSEGRRLKGGDVYDLACADPFAFLANLRGGEVATDGFDPESMNKSAHDVGAGRFDEEEINIARTIREVVFSKSLVPRDMKIDDSGIPVAKNILEWCTKDRFSMINGERPYIEQMVWGLITFNEYCVAKGSLVFTDKGLQRIENLVGNPTKSGMSTLKSRVLTDSGIKATSHGGMTSKRRKCLKVTYASGHSITVTPEHQVQVLNDALTQTWVRAENLKLGDMGIMPYGANLWAKKDARLKAGFVPESTKAKRFEPLTVVTPELARLTGYIISDGFFNKNTIGFINTDDAVIEDFVACCEAVFGHTPKVELGFKDKGAIQSKVPYKNVFLHGRSFVEWLKFIGFTGTNSYTKVIPEYVLGSTKTIVVNCLRAIFDCDGFVDYNRVGITLSSQTCVEQIALLMQNLGIYGKHSQSVCTTKMVPHREVGDVRSLRGSWVCKNPEGVDLYAQEIGSIHSMKSINLESARAAKAFSVSHSKTALPGTLPFCKALYARASALRDGYHDKGLSASKFSRRDYGTISSMLNDPEFVEFFERKCPSELNRIRKLAKANYAFSEIVSIEDAGFQEVYDLTVPSVENFVCNGVVVHNCPRCTDVEYLFDTHKADDTYRKLEKRVAVLENGVCPHCKWGRAKLIAKKKMNLIQELAVCAGQRSGKSLSIAGYFAPYLTHRLLKLQNPNAVYGLKTGTMLHCTFVALTYAQAKDTLWQNFYATLTESAWFKEYHSMLRFYEDKYGEKLLKFNDTYVAYPTRGLMAYPAGPDKRVLRGRTRYFTAVDEVGYFDSNRDTKKVKDNAHEVCGALDRSLLTVRGAAERLLHAGYDDVYPGYAMNVSSPSHRNDMIMTLIRRAENSNTMYGIVRPTWDVNPTLPRNSATIKEAFRIDPLNAERDYGAVPPLAANTFLQNLSEIENVQGSKYNPLTILRRVVHVKKRGESFTWAEIKKLKKGKHPTILALDAGYTNNSFSGAVGRLDDSGNVRIECLFEVIPDIGAPLNHTKIFDELILPIMEARNVRILLADRWNSIKLLQDAKAQRPELEVAAQHSLKYKDIFNIKTLVQQGTIITPAAERGSFKECIEFDDEHYPRCFEGQPASHLLMQFATVKDTGKSIDKADGYTDDLFRAVALCTWGLNEEEFQDILAMSPMVESNSRPIAIGASKLYSGGGGSIGGGSQSVPVIGIYSGNRR